MKTFIIQYLNDGGELVNYISDDGFPVEFLSLMAAVSVAKDLSGLETFPNLKQSWCIKHSTGEVSFLKDF